MTQVNLLGYNLYLSKAHTNTDYKNERNRINKEPRPAEEEPSPYNPLEKERWLVENRPCHKGGNTWINTARFLST